MATNESKLEEASASTSDTEPFEIVDREEVISEPDHDATTDSMPNEPPQEAPSGLSPQDVPRVHHLFDRVLMSNSRQLGIDPRVELFILGMIIHAARPLRMSELADIFSFLYPEPLPCTSKDLIRMLCGVWFRISADETIHVNNSNVVDFLHQTNVFADRQLALERRFPVLEDSEFHRSTAIDCLNYLIVKLASTESLLEPLLNGRAWAAYRHTQWRQKAFNEVVESLNAGLPFLQYASSQWTFHARESQKNDESLFRRISHFIQPEKQSFRTWSIIEWGDGAAEEAQIHPSSLHVAGYGGLHRFTNWLLDTTADLDLDCVDAIGRTPLWWAARYNHEDMATLLIAHGAALDKPDNEGIRPLHVAIQQRHSTIVQMLLQGGVDIMTFRPSEMQSGFPNENYQTAAEYVSKLGDSATIVAMIPFASKEILEMMVCWSCEYINPTALETLLDHANASADSELENITALARAVRKKSVACVKTLLARGVNVLASSKLSVRDPAESILHTVARSWHSQAGDPSETILDLLLKVGADLTALDENGDPPLFVSWAWDEAERSAMKHLLAAGADPKATGKNNESIVYRCLSESWRVSHVELLLSHGAELATQTSDGHTIWHAIMKSDHMDKHTDRLPALVDFLIERGAGPLASIADNKGLSGLEAFAKSIYCHVETFEALFDACPDRSARQRCLWLYHHHEAKEEVRYLRHLMMNGVDLTACNEDGLPFPIYMIHYSFMESITLCLSSLGLRGDLTDKDGRTMMHHYCERDYFATAQGFRDLIKQGLDAKQVDNNGQTVLHAAVAKYCGKATHLALIREIIASGVRVDVMNDQSRTALDILFEDRPDKDRIDRTDYEQLIGMLLKDEHAVSEKIRSEYERHLQAASERSEHDVACLLKVGLAAFDPTSDKETVLHMACRAENSGITGCLLANGADVVKDNANVQGEMPLHVACRRGNFETFYYLLQKGVNVNASDRDGFTALHIFANPTKWWHLEAIKLLLQHGADVNAKAKDGRTPLHVVSSIPQIRSSYCHERAASFWWPECLKILLSSSADPNIMDRNGQSPLYLATVSSAATRTFLELGTDLDLQRPLFAAIMNRNVDSLNLLLEHGADPNWEYEGKRPRQWISLKDFRLTPLLYASSRLHSSSIDAPEMGPLISSLLKHGADPYATVTDKATLIHHHFEGAAYDIVCPYLDDGITLNFAARDQAGRTVLGAAARRRDLDVVRRLVQAGADVRALDLRNRNLLQIVCSNRSLRGGPILELLEMEVTHELVQEADDDGWTPMHYALKYLRPGVCQRLADLGGTLLSPDPEGKTALHRIARQFFEQDLAFNGSGYLDEKWLEACCALWQRVLDEGGDINARDAEGWPPLFDFFAGAEPDVFSYEPLLSQSEGYPYLFGSENVDVHVVGNNGETVLHVIANWQASEEALFDDPRNALAFELMRAKGVDPHAEDSQGRSSLDIAAARGRTDILDLFKGD